MYFQVLGTNIRVLGSVHIVPNGQKIPVWVKKASDWAEQIVFEHDMPSLAKFFNRADGQDLKNSLPADIWNGLAPSWKLAAWPMNNLQLWALALLAGANFMDVIPGVEPTLEAKAKAESKGISFLEQAEDVAAIFNSVPARDLEKSLRMLLADVDRPYQEFLKTYASWVNQDCDTFVRLLSAAPLMSISTIREAMFGIRNRNWATVINEMPEDSPPTLIVVGAGHICGSGSVLEMLEHDVKQIIA